MLVASTFMLWMVAALLSIAVVTLVRQMRALQHAMNSLQPLATPGSASVGDRFPPIVAIDADDRPLLLGSCPSGSRGTLLILLPSSHAPRPPLIELAGSIAAAGRLDLVCVGDDPFDPSLAAAIGARAAYVRCRSAFAIFESRDTPYAILVRSDGVIEARRAVSGREDLDALIATGAPPALADRADALALAAVRRASRRCAA